jgi:uncharacterized repeat protein (TIGR01451 family)
MTSTHRFRSESRTLRSCVFVSGMLLVSSIVSAAPSLWLYPAEAGPREGGHVVPPGEFTLVLENRGQGPEADAAHAVELVVAVATPEAVTALQLVFDGGTPMDLDPGSWEAGVPVLPCSEKPMSRHGEYPAPFFSVALVDLTGVGDLAGGDKVEIDVRVEGDEDIHVHFDAMAIGYKKNERCFDVVNPSGHDVTVANSRGGSGSDDCGHVTVTKTADPTAIDFGETVLFTIEIVNDGSCELTGLMLRDFIPAVEDESGAEYPAFRPLADTVPPYPSDDGLLLEWPFESALPVGESITVELEALFDELLADQRKVVNRACVTAAELRKMRCASAVVTIGNPYGDDGPAGPGFWCHATRWILEDRLKLPVDPEELLEWLVGIDTASSVFSELYSIVVGDEDEIDLAAVADLACSPQSAEGAADRLARHLLVLWLNIASERLDEGQILGELCMGDEILPEGAVPEMTVGDVLTAAEADLVAEADDGQLTFWAEVIDAINNSIVGGEGECPDRRTVSSRHRAGNGWPQMKSKLLRSRD